MDDKVMITLYNKLLPKAVNIHTIIYAFAPIERIHIINVSGYQRRWVIGFGIIHFNRNLIGNVKAHQNFINFDSPCGSENNLVGSSTDAPSSVP